MADSRLLNLPPKMRNRIYRLVLLRQEKVQITEPPLLYSCKAIRRQALSIFYMESQFKVCARDYDLTTALRWAGRRRHLREQSQINIKRTFYAKVGGSPNWSNLLRGAQAIHNGTLHAQAPIGQKYRVDAGIIHAVMAVAAALRDLPWHRVEALLEHHHQALIEYDGRWT